jgi:hypothetical protein
MLRKFIPRHRIRPATRFWFAVLACAAAASIDVPLALAAPAPAGTGGNVILVGWDGAQKRKVDEMLADGTLPNLHRLIEEGGLAATEVTTGATETKPGWTEILTGRSADLLGIESNEVYKPILKGGTIFEILRKRFGAGISLVFIGGKSNNLGDRGPHEICINCLSRMPPNADKTYYWDKALIRPGTLTLCDLPRRWMPLEGSRDNDKGKALNRPSRGLPREGEPDENEVKALNPRRWVPREGEPYFNAVKALDLHRIGLGSAENVGKEALSALDRYHGSRFFAFFHFEDPDEQGHRHGSDSKEYGGAIRNADFWLGSIVEKLKARGIYDRTAIFVTTDHGMDEDSDTHRCAPHTFLATNLKRPLRAGDRKDVTPTLLQAVGIDPAGISPKLDGQSLFSSEPKAREK